MKNGSNTVSESVKTKPSNACKPSIVWFRRDLRITDNSALREAVKFGGPVICVFILESGQRAIGGASKWWLHHSLAALSASITQIGGQLVLRRGNPVEILDDLVDASGAQNVFWNRRYDAAGMETDKRVKARLTERNLVAQSLKSNLLFEPWDIEKKSGGYYKVYTPFKRACLSAGVDRPALAAPDRLLSPEAHPDSDTLEDWGLLPTNPDWSKTIAATWTPGEEGAKARLSAFLHDDGIVGYREQRNLPAIEGTSRLSPHIAFGEISPYQIWSAATAPDLDIPAQDLETFLSEVLWREFSYTLLFYNPDLASRNFQPRFDGFPWEGDADRLPLWQNGQTGYPMVDAGLRQLWQTGWMHNRVRMITASFLVKHMLLDWRHGEDWFWDTLVDADPANNAASWQWVAGSGADAAPYFRIFNPMSQGEKFDREGAYIRQFVPELKDLPTKYLYAPWKAPADVLKKAGVELGKTYPKPIVEHSLAREKALSAFAKTKEAA
tara:strand:+ start:4963 stop:6450 length:1488 start_codon:yes stop_codon:yes gene_type:complete